MNYTIISWNVNGLRQRHQMGQFLPVFRHNPDIVCIQETKTTKDRIPQDLKKLHGYHCYFEENHPEDLSEVILFSRKEPEKVTFGFGKIPFDSEGRIIVAEYDAFTLLNMYFPLGRGPADTLEHKIAFYDAFLTFVSRLTKEEQKVIICGDFSIAHTDHDIAKPLKNTNQRIGITGQEREKIDLLIRSGFCDTLRLFDENGGHFSWWPNGFYCRDRKFGWRLDYFFVNAFMRPFVTSTEILSCYEGSDHCLVILEINLPESPPPGSVKERENPVRQTGRLQTA
jgi:exodeoxyribonuclease-3